MKKSLILLFLCYTYCAAWAQLTNNGATIFIEPGATLTIDNTDLIQTSGTISNSGEIIVEGNFENQGTFNSTAATSALTFIGNTNSTFIPGSTNLRALKNQKTNADISLVGGLTVTNSIDFSAATNAKINIDNAFLTISENGTIDGTSPQKYITTNGTGFLIKKVFGAGNFTFPVGNNNGQTALTSNYTGSSFSNSSIQVKVNPVAEPDLPASATDYIKRHWEVIGQNIVAFENEVAGSYLSSDVSGQESLIKGASYEGSQWSYRDAGRVNTILTGTIGSANTTFTGSNFYGTMNLVTFLQGAYNTTTGLMSTTLADNNLIPLLSPYSDAPATATAIPADAVDWIKIELRDANNPLTVLAKKSGFLLSDGSVADVDGASVLSLKDAPTTSHLAIYHRNHLTIRTNSSYDLSDPSQLDFSISSNVFNKTSVTTNPPQKLLTGTVYGMWSGDVNGNNTISYNGGSNDRTAVLTKVGFTTPNNTVAGYSVEDINLDGNVSYSGGSNDRTTILINVGFTTPNKTISAHID